MFLAHILAFKKFFIRLLFSLLQGHIVTFINGRLKMKGKLYAALRLVGLL